MLYVFFMIRGF